MSMSEEEELIERAKIEEIERAKIDDIRKRHFDMYPELKTYYDMNSLLNFQISDYQKEYRRQIKESDGFDITQDIVDLVTSKPLPAGGGFILPLRMENDPTIIALSHLALLTYNLENAQNYIFVKNLTVNSSAAGRMYYITFVAAKDADYPQNEDTFQARVWWGSDGARDVHFCRLKKNKTSSTSHQVEASNLLPTWNCS